MLAYPIRRLLGSAAFASTLASSALLAPAAMAQTLIAQSAEEIINTTVAGAQQSPDVVALNDGGYVLAWTDYSETAPDTDDLAVRVRIFNSDGSERVAEFVANTTYTGYQWLPRLAALSDGNFAIVWQSGATGVGAVARVFDANGVAQTAEITVNTTTATNQNRPDITALTGGGFAIAWNDDNALPSFADNLSRYRFFGPAPTYTPGAESSIANTFSPQISQRSAGGFYIVYETFGEDPGGNYGTRIAAISAAGAVLNDERLSDRTAGQERFVDVIELTGGEVVAGFGENSGALPLALRVFNGSLTAQTTDIDVSEFPSGRIDEIHLLATNDGNFIASYRYSGTEDADASSASVQSRLFNNSGGAISASVQVNSTETNVQESIRGAQVSNGEIVFGFRDGSQEGGRVATEIIGRRFAIGSLGPFDLVSLDASSDFSGQVIASEASGTLSGDLILDFGLSGKFEQMGAGGVVELEVALNNAEFNGPVTVAPDASDNDCDFTILNGGGVGGTSVTYRSAGSVNQCSGFGANDASITLPIRVSSNGDPVSVDVTFTPTADAGVYTGDSERFDLASFEILADFQTNRLLTDPPVGQFDANGDDLLGSGELMRAQVNLNGNVDETVIGGGATTADSADDVLASVDIVVTFPGGVSGIDTSNVALDGTPCSQGAAPDDNVFTCTATGAEWNTFTGPGFGEITIVDDGDPLTSVVAQTPTVEYVFTYDSGFAFPFGVVPPTDIAPIELDDGLDEAIVASANNAFDWARIGSDGTQSNFRITLANGADAASITQVYVTCAADTGGDFGRITLDPSPGNSDPAQGFRTQNNMVVFSSTALGAAAGGSGNCDISQIELQYDENVLSAGDITGAQANRLLLQRNGFGLSDL